MLRKGLNVMSLPVHIVAGFLHRALSQPARRCLAHWPRLARITRSRKLYNIVIAVVVTAIGETIAEHHVFHPLLGDGITAFGLSPLIRILADMVKVEV